MNVKTYLYRNWFRLFLSVCISLTIISSFLLFYVVKQLPGIENLINMRLQVPLRVYTQDEKLVAEFGEMRRIPVKIETIPQNLVNAILATEDQRFYTHPGIDIRGLARAALELLRTGSKSQGGSTITMQVARNFFLSNKKTFFRKFNEILLALKIERTLSKDKILELYLNKIFLGNSAYGVGAAAQVYYGKPLPTLTLPQLAMIAGLPKAPSTLNPLANRQAAIKRRNHVLDRMLEEGFIDPKAYQIARKTPLTAQYHGPTVKVQAPYVAEMARQILYGYFEEELYTEGYKVYTTINSQLQRAANSAIQQQLMEYDQRYGYRGPIQNIDSLDLTSVNNTLKNLQVIYGLQPAIVTDVLAQSVIALLSSGSNIQMTWPGLAWAKKHLGEGRFGLAPQQASEILKVGDVIIVQRLDNEQWKLAQYPEVEGALVALNPNNGAIKALVGGFNYKKSAFNRITQAKRQPGSSFKPFIYTAALDKGFTLASLINDAPIVLEDPSLQNLWRPKNNNHRFEGPTRLRVGLTHSQNLVSIRLLKEIGIPYAIDFISQFGFNTQDLPQSLSLALGSGTVTPLTLARAYAVFANGGYQISPFIIDKITNQQDQVLWEAKPKVACLKCEASMQQSQTLIPIQHQALRVISPQLAYLMTLVMKDVILSGTGRAATILNRNDLAGKTGSTNNQFDAWFAGFNTNLVTTVWVGFDQPQSLHEYSSTLALPIWIEFMRQALANTPEQNMPRPPGLVTVRIDQETGLIAQPGSENTIFETFREDKIPQQQIETDHYYQMIDNQTGSEVDYLF